MDKKKIRVFADTVREKLLDEVKKQAATYKITADGVASVDQRFEDSIVIQGKVFDKRIEKQRDRLIKEVEEKGYEQVIDEVTYTWFNRFVALKYMEVHEYLPVRVVSSKDAGKIEPDILGEALHLDFIDVDKDKVLAYKSKGDSEGLYKYLVLQLCHYLHSIMPFLFEPIGDYTELLFPSRLLHTDSILNDLNTIIDAEDWQEVEIIGWIYEFYIRQRKDEVFANLKKRKKIEKEDIPAATAIFTPKWIVKYMVENSLGRLWLESHPNSDIKKNWKYFIDQEQTGPSNNVYDPKEIKVLDPAMGSGHILVYAYEVLSEIYKDQGYLEDEIAENILNHNLYGLEIDDRSAQLAGFAVMMKARSHDKDLFSKNIELNLTSIQETNDDPEFDEHKFPNLSKLWKIFLDAKNFGTILKVVEFDIEKAENELYLLKEQQILQSFFSFERLKQLLNQYKIMRNKYDCVITNPPYLGSKGMNKELLEYIKSYYKETKRDLFAVFIDFCLEHTKKNGFTSMITMHSWMFISSFEKFRKRILKMHIIDTMVHLGPHAFEQIGGEVVTTTSFVLRS